MYYPDGENTFQSKIFTAANGQGLGDTGQYLIDYGDLLTEGVTLFMVTGNFQKDGVKQEFMFLVNPDKKSLHTLDPFGDNLLYKDAE